MEGKRAKGLTILPFSGGRERERSDRRARPLQWRVSRLTTDERRRVGHVAHVRSRLRRASAVMRAMRPEYWRLGSTYFSST
jgi:hypothetical protein